LEEEIMTTVGLREEWVPVAAAAAAAAVVVVAAGQPYVPSVDAYAEQRLFSKENVVTARAGWTLCCTVLH
jgi:hypothetical protein